MAILNRIKVVLVEQQKTGRWLAEQLGKSTCTVSKWCSNTIQPDLATLDKIATLLNVDVRELWCCDGCQVCYLRFICSFCIYGLLPDTALLIC